MSTPYYKPGDKVHHTIDGKTEWYEVFSATAYKDKTIYLLDNMNKLGKVIHCEDINGAIHGIRKKELYLEVEEKELTQFKNDNAWKISCKKHKLASPLETMFPYNLCLNI